ncbi:metallophosphoesterase family protein [Romboutsia lituseburensis]|uniref:metallophosphoesterase family protein n=1 Tax=Romboutsia lituseburensis TaxID=1537 RepID=UPI0022EB9BE3|nr:metallophosphoesterase family protein [Romboutsia lituseburensis]
MIIGLISDTHGLLREEVIQNLEGCDLIIHAGDIGKYEVLDKLKEIAPLEVVLGNCDRNIDDEFIATEKIVQIGNQKLYIIHDISKLNIDLQQEKINFVVYGHSHKRNIYTENGIIYINPGSVGPKRFKLPTTMVKLYIDEELTDEKFLKFDNYYIEFINI